MKKIEKTIIIVLCLILGVTAFAACGGEKDILVISRESGSGTRDAFDGLVKNSAGDNLSKKADGSSYDAVVKTADIQNSTGSVITKVAGTKTAIGYVSLSAVNSTVKALTIGGIAASAENVLNGSYKMQRPFVIVSNKSVALTAATADFIKYLGSNQAQVIVAAQKYVRQDKTENAYDYLAPQTIISGKVVIKGSTSVDPLIDKLIANYMEIGGNKITDIEFSKDAQGSSQGISAAKSDTEGNVIGMSSSAIKATDSSSLNYFSIALDAVAIIVHSSNALTNVTIANLYNIYTGATTKYSAIVG